MPSGQTASLLPSEAGGLAFHSKIGTSVRSLMGSKTLSVQKLIDQEEEREEQKAEVDAKHGEARRKALQQLFQDFEDQQRE